MPPRVTVASSPAAVADAIYKHLSTPSFHSRFLAAALVKKPARPSHTHFPAFRPFHHSTKLRSVFDSPTGNMSVQPGLVEDATPQMIKDQIKNGKGLHLLTMSTPNGQKVQILLEELKAIYGISWTTTLLSIMTNVQKEDWFLRLDPNGRIPVLVDSNQSPTFTVHETSAELLYLLKQYDSKDIFGFTDELERNQCLQWMFFWHGSGAPYQGQMNHFGKFAKEKIPYAIDRFRNETLRVYGVLEIHLSGKYTGEPREYLAGKGKGKYSVADITTWPWVKGWEFSGVPAEEMEKLPHLKAWIDRIAQRPAVKAGISPTYALDNYGDDKKDAKGMVHF